MSEFDYSHWKTSRGLWGEIGNRAGWTERDIDALLNSKRDSPTENVVKAKALLAEYERRHTAVVSALWVVLFGKKE